MGLTLPQQFTNAQALQGQLAALPAPQLGPVDLSGGGGPPAIPAPSLMPTAQPNQVLTDQDKLGALRSSGSGISQIHNPFLRGLAETGDVVGSILAPRIEQSIPGTNLHHQVLVNQAQQNLANDQATQLKTAQTENLNLQPQLKEDAAALNQNKLDEKTEHDQDTVDAKQAQLDQQRHLALARNGQMEVTGVDGQTHIADDPDSQVYQQRQAVQSLNQSRQDLVDAQRAYEDARTKNLPLQMQQAQEKIANAQHNTSVAEQRLGLSSQEFAFNQDKFYNPQPTGTERTRGDLAQSAVNQIHTMRSILAAHPEFQGPGGEATQAFNRWLSSNGADAGKFLASRDYLADHSMAVFGGRSAYIAQQLQGLTSGNFSPSTLGGVLDQAEDTATHFSKAGAVHGKSGSPDNQTPPGKVDYKFVNGKLVAQ